MLTLAQRFLVEVHHEGDQTRKVFALIPEDQAEFTPHPRSYPLGPLAQHITELFRWVPVVVEGSELDLMTLPPPEPFVTRDALLTLLDRHVAEGIEALRTTSDADLELPWSLRAGETVFFTLPRYQNLRFTVLSHIIHHRAQLVLYLRLLDIPIPGLYGPSADEI